MKTTTRTEPMLSGQSKELAIDDQMNTAALTPELMLSGQGEQLARGDADENSRTNTADAQREG